MIGYAILSRYNSAFDWLDLLLTRTPREVTFFHLCRQIFAEFINVLTTAFLFPATGLEFSIFFILTSISSPLARVIIRFLVNFYKKASFDAVSRMVLVCKRARGAPARAAL